jgi:phosphoenolpyruvate-protein kinase (PTS system EI component)
VNSGELLEIKNAIRSTDMNHAESLAGEVLELGTVKEIKARLREAVSTTMEKSL